MSERLIEAAKKCNVDAVRDALNEGADVELRDPEGLTAADHAFRQMRGGKWQGKAILELLGTAGARHPMIDRLQVVDAARAGDLTTMRRLMERDLDREVWEEGLIDAAGAGHEEIVAALLEKGVRVDPPDDSPLLMAAYHGHLGCVRRLVDAGADLEARVACVGTALDYSCLGRDEGNFPQQPYDELITFLRSKGVVARGIYARTAVRARRDTAPPVRPPELGAPPGEELRDLDRSLFRAVADAGETRRLLRRGADANAAMDESMEELESYEVAKTVLMEAATLGDADVVRELLNAGADIHARDGSIGFTPLHYAAMHGHAGVARQLIEAGADPDARDVESSPPIHWAAGGGHADVVRVLIEAGADLQILDADGESALSLAQMDEIVAMLRTAGAEA